MKPAVSNTELRQPVLGGSSLLRKSFLGALAISSVALLSPLVVTATDYKLKIPFGLEETAVVIPADNPLTKEKVELGRILFFDKRLSQDNTIACANCHLAKFGFTDGMPVSTGIRGQKGGRSAPASFNRVFSSAQFWDGRAATLEAQSIGPFTNPIEHGFTSYDLMVAKMNKIPGYRKLFKEVFGDENIKTSRLVLSARPSPASNARSSPATARQTNSIRDRKQEQFRKRLKEASSYSGTKHGARSATPDSTSPTKSFITLASAGTTTEWILAVTW